MKRFWKAVTVGEEGGGYRVLLDGRGIKTAQARAQIVPTRALAEALAAEWAAQGEEINAGAFMLRDLTDLAIDLITPAREVAIAEIVPYGETDTLCYRGDPDEALYKPQMQVWEPLLASAEQRWGVRFTRVSGIVHRPQPPETLARLKAALEAESDFSLAAVKMMASLAASLVIALAAIEPDADAKTLWDAASLEEDWQAELWGQDELAEERRAGRYAAFTAAIRFAKLARDG